MKKYFVFLTLIFLSMACCDSIPITEDEIMLNKIVRKHITLQRKKGLYAFGTGGSNAHGITRGPSISYLCYQPVDVNQARKLFVEISEEIINMINECQELQPHLYRSPFIATSQKAEVVLHLDH